MPNYDVNDLAQVGGLKSLAQRTQAKLDALQSAQASNAFQSLRVDGNTVYFYKTADMSGTAAASFNFAEEIFLQQTGTEIVENFAFNSETYVGATNPNLDGKTVLVLAVKGDKAENPTVKYSFVSMEKLIKSVVAAAGDSSKILTISGYTITVNIDPSATNLLTVTANGLMVDGSGKADKVQNATAGHVATLDANGNLTDSGHGIATDAAVNAMLDEVMGTDDNNDS